MVDAWSVGSPFYMAPEVLLDKGLDTPADVYSFSIIMWETIANEVRPSSLTRVVRVIRFAD